VLLARQIDYLLKVKPKIPYYQLKGSSIAEVVTAMLIISLSMALTGMLVADIFGSSGRYLRHEAWFDVNKYVNITKAAKNIEPVQEVLPRYKIEKSSYKAENENDLWIVIVNAIANDGKVLVTRKFMMEVPADTMVVKKLTSD
jgi:hypothetical protein